MVVLNRVDDNPERRMTIVEHLAELRTRILWSLGSLVLATALAAVFVSQILEVLRRPLGDLLAAQTANGQPAVVLITTEPTEAFGVFIKVALLSGLILSFPMHIYQTVMFVAPGLLPHEKRLLYTFLPFATASFLAGVIFGYFILLPPAIQFLLTFGVDYQIAQPYIKVSSYIDLVVRLLLWIGVAFETPIFMLILGRLGILRYAQISRFRKYAIVGAWVAAALITPTFDPVNQTLVALPLMVLFEIGAQLVRLFGKR
ncbi:MAG: Sec-independent protein translocase protein TatC [Dehalococcoidia bacterium]|nr:MAG: Sec-independent protein translocase protein TatC [Dehalococcoidia bacterium]